MGSKKISRCQAEISSDKGQEKHPPKEKLDINVIETILSLLSIDKETASTDEKRRVGCRIHAKASQITSESECRRLLGINCNSKMGNGTVKSAVQRPSPTGRLMWYVTATYEFPGDELKTNELPGIKKVSRCHAEISSDKGQEKHPPKEKLDINVIETILSLLSIDKETASNDEKRRVGCRIHAKASQITSESDCRRLLGINCNSKMGNGTVKSAVQRPSSTIRLMWYVTAAYEFPADELKTKEKPIGSLKHGPVPSARPPFSLQPEPSFRFHWT
jgi:hypothetical protein